MCLNNSSLFVTFELFENLNFRGRLILMIILDKSPQLGKGILHLALNIKVILFGELYVRKVVLKRSF
jgi:hypothetical protein